MKQVYAKSVLLIALVGLLSACASVDLNKDEAKGVKKIAIIGIEMHQQQPKDALGLSTLKSLAKGEEIDQVASAKMTQDIFNQFNRKFSKKLNWEVVDFKTLKKNKGFQEKVKKRFSGKIRRTFPIASGYKKVFFPGLLDEYAVREMSHDEKMKIARSLGADAYGSLWISVSIDQGFALGNLMGDAAFSSKARANLKVYSKSGEEPLLSVENVDGEETKNSDDLSSKLTKVQKLNQLGKQATMSAIDQALSKL